jgi:hypothetical protein
MRDAGLLGLAVALTLVAGLALAGFEELAARRGWRYRELRRPGGVALLIGAAVTAAIAGLVPDNLFIGVAGVVAAVSGLQVLRRSGRLFSFVVLWILAIGVVLVLDAQLVAFGVRGADVAFTALLLATFCNLLREADSYGWYGWGGALVSAGAMTAMFYWLDRGADARLGLLITGAVFAVISAVPFGSGMLGRTGARFIGLVIGGLAIRATEGTPSAAIVVVALGIVCALAWLTTLPSPDRGRVGLSLGAVGLLLGGLSVPAALALAREYKPLNRTVAQSRVLVRVDPQGGLATASARLVPLHAQFNRSATNLEKPIVQLGRFVPFLGANLRAATVSARSAANLSASAKIMLDRLNVGSVSPHNGKVDRQALRNLNGGLRNVLDVIDSSHQHLDQGGSLDLLVPPLRKGVRDLLGQLDSVGRRARVTVHGTVVADRLLGFDQPRTFFVAMQNNAESRATGGYIANYGIVTMRDGGVESRAFKRTSEFDDSTKHRTLHAPLDFRRRYSQFDVDRNWTNVNLSPDYPTIARIVADQYRQFSDKKVDGVFTLDPFGIAGLLKLTGPVRVASWPVPLTDRNFVNIALHDEYRAFDNNQAARLDFLGQVGEAVFDKLIASGLNNVIAAAPVIDDLITSRRLQMWSPHAATNEFFAETGSTGAIRPTAGDSLIVTTQNAAANKTDYFLRRSITYEARVARKGNGIAVDSVATVQLTNTAPSTGEPRYVIGPNTPRLKAGENRLFVTIYSPFDVTTATLDGQPLHLDFAPELGRFAYSAFVSLPPGNTRTIVLRFAGSLSHVTRYTLDVFHQPVITPDIVRIKLDGAGPKGVVDVTGPLTHDQELVFPVPN